MCSNRPSGTLNSDNGLTWRCVAGLWLFATAGMILYAKSRLCWCRARNTLILTKVLLVECPETVYDLKRCFTECMDLNRLKSHRKVYDRYSANKVLWTLILNYFVIHRVCCRSCGQSILSHHVVDATNVLHICRKFASRRNTITFLLERECQIDDWSDLPTPKARGHRRCILSVPAWIFSRENRAATAAASIAVSDSFTANDNTVDVIITLRPLNLACTKRDFTPPGRSRRWASGRFFCCPEGIKKHLSFAVCG